MEAENTKHMHITFRNEPVENKAKSAKEGRPIFDDREAVEIRFVGDPKKILVAPAHQKCMRDPETGLHITYAQRFHKHYNAFKSGQALVGDGTPISELPFLSEAKRAELRALNIHTAEGLAGLEGTNLSRLGMFGRDLKEKATAYIAKAKDSALETRLSAENAMLKARLEALEKQMQAPATAPTAPEIEEESEDSPFDAWPDAELKTFIKEKTGTAPKGQPSHATLVRMAQDAFGKEAEAA